MNCKYCRANCTGAKHDREFAFCLGYDPPKTNADRLRAMSDEDLAKFLYNNSDGQCPAIKYCPTPTAPQNCSDGHCWLDWLRQEATE